jgi:hypothetical protein
VLEGLKRFLESPRKRKQRKHGAGAKTWLIRLKRVLFHGCRGF